MMRIDRIFSQQSLNPAGPAFDRGGPDGTTGALQGTQAEGAALARAFARETAARERRTAALVAKGQSDMAFGRVIGRAGQDLTELAVQAQQRRNRGLAETEYQNAKAALARASDAAEEHAVQGALDGSDYASRYTAKYNEGRDGILAALSNPDSRPLITAHAEALARAGANRVRVRQAGRETRFSVQQLDIRTADRQKRIAARRGPEQQRAIAEATADIAEQQRLGNIANGQSRITALRLWAQGTIGIDAQADPAGAGAALAAGGYDHLFADGAEKAAAGAVISGALKTQRAMERREVAGLIAEDLASREATGHGAPGLRQRLVNLGDGPALRDYDEKAAHAVSYFATMTEIRFAPTQEAWDLVRARRPEPGSESFTVKRKLYLTAVKAFQDRQRQFAHDPAGYAAAHPAQRAPAGSRAKNIALQQVIGGQDFPYRYFSRQDAAQAAADYDQATAEDKPGVMARLLANSGSHREVAIRDLLPFSHSPSAAIVALHADKPALTPVLARVIAAEAKGPGELEKHLTAAQTAALKAAIAGQLAPFFRTASAAGAREAAIAEQTRDGIYLYALDLMAAGRSAEAAARTAAGKLVNDHFDFAATYRVPRTFNFGNIQAYTAAVLADWPRARRGAPGGAYE
ncbi:MAG: hypothetical protein O2967_17755 [Proteobacteria bacterium]|nr:hypothetical protein [Pseudomonadota bacterium]